MLLWPFIETDARNDEDTTIPDHSVLCSDSVGNFREPCDEEHHADIQRLKRECHVMNCFMRALWNVLKEYKQKVEVLMNFCDEFSFFNSSR